MNKLQLTELLESSNSIKLEDTARRALNRLIDEPDHPWLVDVKEELIESTLNAVALNETRARLNFAKVEGDWSKVTEEDYQYLVGTHDTYYNYSDDLNVWRAGEKNAGFIATCKLKHPEYKTIDPYVYPRSFSFTDRVTVDPNGPQNVDEWNVWLRSDKLDSARVLPFKRALVAFSKLTKDWHSKAPMRFIWSPNTPNNVPVLALSKEAKTALNVILKHLDLLSTNSVNSICNNNGVKLVKIRNEQLKLNNVLALVWDRTWDQSWVYLL